MEIIEWLKSREGKIVSVEQISELFSTRYLITFKDGTDIKIDGPIYEQYKESMKKE